MLNTQQNLKIVRASAWYDLFATAAFTTPWTAIPLFSALATVAAALGLERPVPAAPDAALMLFANLLGSVVVVWSLWRLRHASRRVGHYDALARALFAIWQLFAVSQGASLLILAFTLMEIAFGIAQVLPVRQGVPVHDEAVAR